MMLLENVHKSYKSHQVLKGLTLTAVPGVVLSMIGKNGSGKSTLINMMAGIASIDSGKITINDEVVSGTSYKYKNLTGFVTDKDLGLSMLYVREYLKFCGMMYSIDAKTTESRIEEYFNFFELNNIMVGECSKGMKAKVSLAAALIHRPKYLILDEPFDGMDFMSVQKCCKLLRQMAANGACILLTSHQYDTIASVADRFALLKDGRIAFDLDMPSLLARAEAAGFGQEKEPVKAYLEHEMGGTGPESLSWI